MKLINQKDVAMKAMTKYLEDMDKKVATGKIEKELLAKSIAVLLVTEKRKGAKSTRTGHSFLKQLRP